MCAYELFAFVCVMYIYVNTNFYGICALLGDFHLGPNVSYAQINVCIDTMLHKHSYEGIVSLTQSPAGWVLDWKSVYNNTKRASEVWKQSEEL